MLLLILKPQGDYIDLHIKRHGRRHDHFERKRKKEARQVHKHSQIAQKVQPILLCFFILDTSTICFVYFVLLY